MTSLSHSGAVHIFPIAALDLSLDYDHVRRQLTADQYKRMSLFNASAQYKWKRLVLRLELDNLLNQRHYAYTVFDGINTYTYDYGLCGRTALTISAYKTYFRDFIQSLTEAEARKVFYVIDMLKTQERVNAKFVKYLRDEIFELRAEHGGNIFRVFFIFDDGNVVMLFNGFQKKTQKTPEKEINKAIQLKKEYYAGKK